MAPHDPVELSGFPRLTQFPRILLSPALSPVDSQLEDMKIPSLPLGSSQGRPSPFLDITAFPTAPSHALLAGSCIGFLQPIFYS